MSMDLTKANVRELAKLAEHRFKEARRKGESEESAWQMAVFSVGLAVNNGRIESYMKG